MKNYNNAVTALASGIESTQRELNRDGKLSIAEEMLKHGPENHSNWSNLELNLSQESIGNLQEYHGNLQRAYSEEIGKEIKQTMERVEEVTDLRERLHSELNRALDETRELEEIAERLQDRGIGNVAGKEERQVRELGKNLEKLDSKGEDLGKLENRLESLLDSHNLDKEDLHEELGRRAEAVEKILDSAGSTGRGKADLDQIANTIIQEESELQKAKSRGLQQLEDDIKTLSSIVELEEQEISALRQVEKYIQNGNFGQASSTLDSLIQRRENFGDQSRAVQQIKQYLQEEKKIIIALQKFFNSIKQLENKGISRDRLYQRMESQGSFSSAQEARDFFTGLESEFGDIEEDIARVKELEQKERKLENLEHEKLKEINREDSELRKNSDPQEKQKLKNIHEKLQRLNFSLENDINTSSNKGGSSGSDPDSLEGPTKNGDPWIVSISDIHGNIQEATQVFGGLEKAGFKPVVDSSWNWKGNNYILVFNGDSFDGRDRNGEKSPEVFKKIKNLKKNQGERIVHTYGNHDMFIPTAEYQKLIMERHGRYNDPFFIYCIENSSVRNWILKQMRDVDGMYKASYSRYSFTYTHTGITYADAESDLEDLASDILKILSDEHQLNRLFENLRDKSLSFTNFVTSRANRPEHLSRDKSHQLSNFMTKDVQSLDNELKKALITGFLQYKKYAELWDLTTKRWSDVVEINHNNPKIIGHNKKGSCNSGTSIWQKGTNPRKRGKIVNENTIRDGDNPCLMLEKPNGELFAVRKDGEVEIVNNS